MKDPDKMLRRELLAEVKDTRFQIDRIKEQYDGLFCDNEAKDLEIKDLKKKIKQFKQMIFDAAGHIIAVKHPTKHGLTFAGQMYVAVSDETFCSETFANQKLFELRNREAQAGLAETIESRKGK